MTVSRRSVLATAAAGSEDGATEFVDEEVRRWRGGSDRDELDELRRALSGADPIWEGTNVGGRRQQSPQK